MNRKHPRARLAGGTALIGAAALVAATLTAPATADPGRTADTGSDAGAAAGKKQTSSRNGTVRGVYDHLIELEEIAERSDDNRAAGTAGYNRSARYVMRKLRRAGYRPRRQAFEFAYFEQTAPSTFEQTSPTPTTYAEDEDYYLMTYSGSGETTATVEGVDLALANPADSSSGCEASDFDGFTSGNVALLQRGTCAFADKVTNAQDAGATGVIVFNQGTEGRLDAFAGTLGGPVGEVPAIGTSFAIGEQLASADSEVHLTTSTVSEDRTTWNVVAQTRKGRKNNIVMAGAHLDSVLEGHGINDNGSGSAALLEVAEAMGKKKQRRKVRNTVRFAWWGAEELGLLGSEHYVADLAERRPRRFQDIALYLNFDMVGSPNYMLGVYDGNNDSFPPEESAEAPEGSAAIERSFHRFFRRLGTGSVDTAFSGRSDYGPFIALNVPAGGLFTGAEGVKTEEEAELFGGEAGVAYDECYHSACDDLGNVSRAALRANTKAINRAVSKYARSTRSVNGSRTGHEPPAETSARAARPYDAPGRDAARR